MIIESELRTLASELGVCLHATHACSGIVAEFEHLAHEVGHAMNLGLSLQRCTDRPRIFTPLRLETLIDMHIDGNPKRPRRRHREEATVLAAESMLFRRMDLPEDVGWAALAKDQGCHLREWHAAIRSPRSRHLAVRIYQYFIEQGVIV